MQLLKSIMMNNITLEEIKAIEEILLPTGQTFGDETSERVSIIKDITNSCHVVACPGSGKTTVLLAKLLILAERMPFENNQGICVLTHTNVAIDEIKRKAGAAGEKLFKYPNYFGTIQSFVDKYLAAPALIKYYGTKPLYIDNEIANEKLTSSFLKLPKYDNILHKYLWNQLYDEKATFSNDYLISYFGKEDEKDFIQNMITCGILECVSKSKSKLSKSVKEDFLTEKGIEDVKDRNKFINLKTEIGTSISSEMKNEIISFSLNYPKETISSPGRSLSLTRPSGMEFLRLKENLFKEGILSFKDAFYLASRYIDSHENIKKPFSNRFKYIFIDEMQDTDSHQLKIIEELFKNTKTIIQYYGDPNQAIFEKTEAGNIWKPEKKDGFELYNISDSKRFGQSVVEVLNRFKVYDEITLVGNENVNSLKPIQISFEDAEKVNVIKKFAEIIKIHHEKWKKELNKEPVYKAIGWVGTEKDKEEQLTIKSYFPTFQSKSEKIKQSYHNLRSYLMKPAQAKSFNTKLYFDNIIKAFLKCLDLADVKNEGRYYSKTSLLHKFNDEELKILRKKIVIWASKIHNIKSSDHNEEVITEFQAYIMNEFAEKFDFSDKKEDARLKEFIFGKQITTTTITTNEKKHIYVYPDSDIKIEIGTVHSVKGETHTATLYLETFYNKKYEYNNAIEIVGNSSEDIKKTKKMLHVGFSRPTHLLCFAVGKKRTKDEINGFEKIDINTPTLPNAD